MAGAAGSQSAAPWLGAMQARTGRAGRCNAAPVCDSSKGSKGGHSSCDTRDICYVTDFIKNTAAGDASEHVSLSQNTTSRKHSIHDSRAARHMYMSGIDYPPFSMTNDRLQAGRRRRQTAPVAEEVAEAVEQTTRSAVSASRHREVSTHGRGSQNGRGENRNRDEARNDTGPPPQEAAEAFSCATGCSI